jgi:hypothetical protein
MKRRIHLRTGLPLFAVTCTLLVLLTGCFRFDFKVEFGDTEPASSAAKASGDPKPAERYTDPGEQYNQIDLQDGCTDQQGPGAKPYIVDPNSAEGIMCVGGDNQGESLDIDAYCAATLEGSLADDSDRTAGRYGWRCINRVSSVPVDLAKLCPEGWNLKKFPSERDTYTWRCVNPNQRNAFEWAQYCEDNYPNATLYAKTTRRNDPMSWTCTSSP